MTSPARNPHISQYILAVLRNWIISVVLLMAVILLSPVVSREMMPVISVGLAGFLIIYIYRRRNLPNRGLAVPYITALTLVIAAVVMQAMNLTTRITDVYELAGKAVNDELPFIVQLILSPIAAVCSGVFILRRMGRRKYFRSSIGRSDVGPMQRLVWRESRYQVRMLFILSSVLTAVEWSYCYFCFITSNLNHPDRFFFVMLPVALYVLSIIFLGIHYASLHALYNQEDIAKLVGKSRNMVLRFLIVSGDNLLVTKKEIRVKQGETVYFDTPVRAQRPYKPELALSEARQIFAENSGLTGCDTVRFLFSGVGLTDDNTILHYMCHLTSPDAIEDSRVWDSEWCDMAMMRELDRMHLLSAELSSELVHLYTVGNASKLYDINGNRRYGIKGYRPSLHLGEIMDLAVDFNDPAWLKVARVNADRPFFRLRRLFGRLHTSPSR